MGETNRVTIKQGFAGNLTITVLDSNQTPVNLTGATIYFSVKAKKGDASDLITKSSSSGITTVSAAAGTCTVALTRAETLALTKNVTAELTLRYASDNIIPSKDIVISLTKAVNTGTIT